MKSTLFRNVEPESVASNTGNVDVTRRTHSMPNLHLSMSEHQPCCRLSVSVSNRESVRRKYRASDGKRAWLWELVSFFCSVFSSFFFAHNPISRHNGNKNTICFELFFLHPVSICWLYPPYYCQIIIHINAYDMTSMSSCFSCRLFRVCSRIRWRIKIAPRHMNGWLWSKMASFLRVKTKKNMNGPRGRDKNVGFSFALLPNYRFQINKQIHISCGLWRHMSPSLQH